MDGADDLHVSPFREDGNRRCLPRRAALAAHTGTPRVDWAEMLRRRFDFEVFACVRCGGRRRVLAYVKGARGVPEGPAAGACSFPGAPSWQEKAHQAREGLDLRSVQARKTAQAAREAAAQTPSTSPAAT